MNIRHIQSAAAAVIILTGVAIAPARPAHAVSGTPVTTDPSSISAQRLATIITKGDQEITRRLTSLATLNSKITSATRLSASDSAYLNSEVATEVSGLTTLKTKLDAETTLAGAKTDAQSIINDYRVYALIMPKIGLVRTADSEQVTETKLLALATKLQSRITTAQTKHQSVANLQAKLADLTTQATNAQGIARSIESKVLTLQPTDYNSDHTLLSGDRDQLVTAHGDNLAALADAKAIVSALKAL